MQHFILENDLIFDGLKSYQLYCEVARVIVTWNLLFCLKFQNIITYFWRPKVVSLYETFDHFCWLQLHKLPHKHLICSQNFVERTIHGYIADESEWEKNWIFFLDFVQLSVPKCFLIHNWINLKGLKWQKKEEILTRIKKNIL